MVSLDYYDYITVHYMREFKGKLVTAEAYKYYLRRVNKTSIIEKKIIHLQVNKSDFIMVLLRRKGSENLEVELFLLDWYVELAGSSDESPSLVYISSSAWAMNWDNVIFSRINVFYSHATAQGVKIFALQSDPLSLLCLTSDPETNILHPVAKYTLEEVAELMEVHRGLLFLRSPRYQAIKIFEFNCDFDAFILPFGEVTDAVLKEIDSLPASSQTSKVVVAHYGQYLLAFVLDSNQKLLIFVSIFRDLIIESGSERSVFHRVSQMTTKHDYLDMQIRYRSKLNQKNALELDLLMKTNKGRMFNELLAICGFLQDLNVEKNDKYTCVPLEKDNHLLKSSDRFTCETHLLNKKPSNLATILHKIHCLDRDQPSTDDSSEDLFPLDTLPSVEYSWAAFCKTIKIQKQCDLKTYCLYDTRKGLCDYFEVKPSIYSSNYRAPSLFEHGKASNEMAILKNKDSSIFEGKEHNLSELTYKKEFYLKFGRSGTFAK